jgi:hypothetical protein
MSSIGVSVGVSDPITNPPGTIYVAPNAICNAWPAQGQTIVNAATAEGIPGCTLWAVPIGASPNLRAVPQVDFGAAQVPAGAINLYLQVPGASGMNNIGMMRLDMQNGMTLKQALQ